MEQINNTPATLESVWAAFRETDRLLKESRARFEQEIAASRAEREQEMKESRARFEQDIKKLNEMMGGMANSNGMFAEEYFVNSFDKSKHNLFGEKFDKLTTNAKGIDINDEYDILLINGKSVGIVEVKYKARLEDVAKVLKKAETFRVNYPKYQNYQVYLGLATLISSDRIEQECIKEGIAFVKQVGESVVINDKHIKVF
jgi:hypothetical protein